MKKYKKLILLITFLFFLFTTSSLAYGTVNKGHMPPKKPIGVTAKTVSSSEIDLKWNSIPGASGYRIYRAVSKNSRFMQISSVKGTAYKNTKLKANTIYWYYIKAYNSYGSSSSSSHVNATTKKPVPAKPSYIIAKQVSTSEIALSWKAVSGAVQYKIYRADSSNSNFILVGTTKGGSYRSINLKPGTTYWYFVRVYNSYMMSSDSAHVYARTMQKASGSKILVGYTTYYYPGDTSSLVSLSNNSGAINEIAADSYAVDGSGDIIGSTPVDQVSYANTNGIKPLMLISNNFNSDIAKTLLENSDNRKRLVDGILLTIQSNAYKGVNIDIENIYYYDRGYFTVFMSELYDALHPFGYEVTVSVPAKTSDSPANTWNYAYNYSGISDYADKIMIMTYDEHYLSGQAGPIASINWVQNVANYAVTAVPKEKILLGIAAYGYDWSSNGGKAYGIDAVYKIASSYNTQIKWDTLSESPYFNYTDDNGILHTVWFENGTSIGYKLDIINNMDLAGAAMWRLGLESTDFWKVINDKL